MKWKLGLNVALLAAVIALALFAYFKPHGGEPENKLSALKPAEANRIKIEIAGTPPIELERVAADWRLTAPLVARAETFQIQRLLEILEAGSKDRFEARGLARFDLNEPYARLTINQQTFSFGAVNQMSRDQYMQTQDGIYLVSLRYGAALPKNPYDLVSKQLFSADEAPIAFDFGSFTVRQNDAKWTLTMTSTTVPAAEAGPDEINGWVDDWRLASALAVQGPTQRKPVGALQVMLKNGNAIVINILERGANTIIARNDQPLEYTIPATAAERLLKPPGTTTRPASPFTAK